MAKAKRNNAARLDKRSNARTGFGGIVAKPHELRAKREIAKKISGLAKLVPEHNINGTLSEDIILASFRKAGCKVVKYSPHHQGSDMNIDGKDISCKTGKLSENGILKISCSRVQKQLQESGIWGVCNKLDQMDPDYFMCLTAMKDEAGVKYYKLIVIAGKSFSFKETEWEGFDEKGFIIPNGPKVCKFTGNGIKGDIKHTMSSQLWLEIDTNIHKPVFVMDIYPKE